MPNTKYARLAAQIDAALDGKPTAAVGKAVANALHRVGVPKAAVPMLGRSLTSSLRAAADGDYEALLWGALSAITTAVPGLGPVLMAAQVLAAALPRKRPYAWLDDYVARLLVHGDARTAVGFDHNREHRGYPMFWHQLPSGSGKARQTVTFAVEDQLWGAFLASVDRMQGSQFNRLDSVVPLRLARHAVLWAWLSGHDPVLNERDVTQVVLRPEAVQTGGRGTIRQAVWRMIGYDPTRSPDSDPAVKAKAQARRRAAVLAYAGATAAAARRLT